MGNDTPTTPTRGVPLTLDGTERHLRFSLKVLDDLRDDLGKDVLREGLTSDVIGTVLFFAMKASSPGLTLEDVKEMVDMQNMPEVTAAIIEASGMQPVDPDAVAEAEEKEKADPLAPVLVLEGTDATPAVVVGAPPTED